MNGPATRQLLQSWPKSPTWQESLFTSLGKGVVPANHTFGASARNPMYRVNPEELLEVKSALAPACVNALMVFA